MRVQNTRRKFSDVMCQRMESIIESKPLGRISSAFLLVGVKTPNVYILLTDFLLALHYDMNREDAIAKAKKINLDGTALYETSEEEFKECLGEDSVFIYRELYRSTYGYVRIWSVSGSPSGFLDL